jgi:hypothetical protein
LNLLPQLLLLPLQVELVAVLLLLKKLISM